MSTIILREKKHSLVDTCRRIEGLRVCSLHDSSQYHNTDVCASLSPEGNHVGQDAELGNPRTYRVQAGGNEARSHCSELESQVLCEGAATAPFQIIVTWQECWPNMTTVSSFSGYIIGILKTWKHQMNQPAISWIRFGRWRESLKSVAFKGV